MNFRVIQSADGENASCCGKDPAGICTLFPDETNCFHVLRKCLHINALKSRAERGNSRINL